MVSRRVAKASYIRAAALLPVVRGKILSVRKNGFEKVWRFLLIVSLAFLIFSISGSPPLDSVPSSTSKRDIMRLKPPLNDTAKLWRSCRGGDENCCRKVGNPSWSSHRIIAVQFPGVSQQEILAVYPMSQGDVVSDSLRFNSVWEEKITGMIQSELGSLGDSAVLLDIGANIGWFTLAAAYAGHRVIALEPVAGNIDYINHSLCLATPDVRNRVTVVHSGLGLQDGQVCELWHQQTGNEGNFRTVCGGKALDSSLKYSKFGVVHLTKLDTLVQSGTIPIDTKDKVLVKIDVEGFEPFVFMGGMKFLRRVQPKVVHSEFSPDMIRSAAESIGWTEEKSANLPSSYLQLMNELGYAHEYVDNSTDIRNIVFKWTNASSNTHIQSMTLFRTRQW